MSDPVWKLLWSTDDHTLYVDSTGERDPEVAVLVQIVDDSEIESSRTAPYHVHRFTIPRMAVIAQYEDGEAIEPPHLVEASMLARFDEHGVGHENMRQFPKHISAYDEWYADDLASIAASAGRGDPSALADRGDNAPDGASALRADLCSADPSVRAWAYLDIVGHWGEDNFDSYPEEWSASEAAEWPERGKLKIRLSPSDDDDGSITVYSDDVYGAITDQSIEGSSWEAPRDMNVAYASILDRADLLSDLEREYDVDADEYSPPSAEDLERWSIKVALADTCPQGIAILDAFGGGFEVVGLPGIHDSEIDAWRAARDHYAKSAVSQDTARHTDEDA